MLWNAVQADVLFWQLALFSCTFLRSIYLSVLGVGSMTQCSAAEICDAIERTVNWRNNMENHNNNNNNLHYFELRDDEVCSSNENISD